VGDEERVAMVSTSQRSTRWIARSIGMTLLVVALWTTGGVGAHTIVATTTIVGDVVRQVAGPAADVAVLLPVDSDPHAFQPTPQDVVAVAEADVVFASGAGLEAELSTLLANATGPVVSLSDGLALRVLAEDGEPDPHVWFDPTYVMVWTRRIAEVLAELWPTEAPAFRERAAAYREELAALDLWIWQETESIPTANRGLVLDHEVLGYFAARYGFERLGSLSPGFSPSAEPSARELAELETVINAHRVAALFVGTTVNPVLAEAVAADTGATIVMLYTGSLSGANGPASDYIAFMQYDVAAMVNALTP